MKQVKTNAMRLLDQAKIPYQIFTYDISDGLIDGQHVVEKLNQNPL